MTSQEMFLRRLRRERERNRVTLEDIAHSSRIRYDLLQGLEQGDLSAWPKGLYARAWVHAYADAVGMDPVETVDEFCRLFPHGDRRAHSTMSELAAIVDEPRRFHEEAGENEAYGRRSTDQLVPAPLSLKARLGRAARIVADARRVRELPTRLAESWRLLRPSRPTP